MRKAARGRIGQNDKSQERLLRLLSRGASLLEQGRAVEAIPYLERAHKFDGDNVATLINLGGAYILAGRHQQAIPLLEKARDAEPENVMIRINLGAAYLGNPVLATADQQMRAIGAFQSALASDPAAPSVHYNLGLIFVDRHDTDLAAAAFRRAIQINPLDHDAHVWLRRLESVQMPDAEHSATHV